MANLEVPPLLKTLKQDACQVSVLDKEFRKNHLYSRNQESLGTKLPLSCVVSLPKDALGWGHTYVYIYIHPGLLADQSGNMELGLEFRP